MTSATQHALSPVVLMTLVHFYYTDRPGPHDRDQTMDCIVRLQALKLATIVPNKGWPCAELTPLGSAYVKAILSTPIPKPVEAFVDERTGEFIK